MVLRSLALVLAIGCGRIGYDPISSDAGRRDGGTDAGIDGGAIDGGREDGGSDGGSDAGVMHGCRTPGCPGRCAPGPFGDAFEDGAQGIGWVSFGTGAVEAGGALAITPPAGAEAFYGSRLQYPMDGSWFAVAVAIADPSARSHGCLVAQDQAFNDLSICQTDGDLILDFESGGSLRLTYDPVAHRFWRIRREGTEAVMEASPDGSLWSELARSTTDVSLSAHVYLRTNAFGLATDGTTYTFDDLSVGGAGSTEGEPIGCPLSLLRDDFEDGSLDPLWMSFTDTGANVMESDGFAVLAPPLALAEMGEAELGTIDFWDLREGALHVEVDLRLSGGDSGCGFEALGFESEDGIGFEIHAGSLKASITVDYVRSPVQEVPYDPTLHRWLRLRAEGSTMYWETSEDGSSWAPFANAPLPAPIGAVRVFFYATKYSGAAVGDARYDDLNL